MSKTALFKAVKLWESETVARLLIANPAIIDVRDRQGRTALHLCAGRPLNKITAPVSASLATAKVLLNAGADINAVHEIQDDNQIFPASPLWYAVARGNNPSLVKMLLKAGANPDYCLWAVAWANDRALAHLLLKAGSNTELRFDSETPLLYASRLGRVDVIRELVNAKSDIHVRDAKNMTPLDYAKKKRLGDDVIALLSGSAYSDE